MRREKELMARHYAQLKAALNRSRATAAERLKQLSVMSGNTMQVRGSWAANEKGWQRADTRAGFTG